MGYEGSKIQLSYEIARILPPDDPTEKEYQQFRKLFGEDGSLMVIGWQSDKLFELQSFNDWYDLAYQIKKHEGIKNVVFFANLIDIKLNEEKKKFEAFPLLKQKPSSQAALDSLKDDIKRLKFYEGMVLNSKTNTTLMAITFNDKTLHTKRRLAIVGEIRELARYFFHGCRANKRHSRKKYRAKCNCLCV